MNHAVFLPEPLPNNPLPLFADWFADACQRKLQPNPDAMTLATVDADGKPSARIVLCKQLVTSLGYIVFFTNYQSRKGNALAATPYAATVFHWDQLHRQVRLEGRILKSPAAESDAYFNSRTLDSQLGAWASQQSQPLSSRQQLSEQVALATARFAPNTNDKQLSIPRPPHWGGYRLWIEHIELWVEGPGRVHDRARWSRELLQNDEYSFTARDWHSTRLNP
ncbi:MAG: pyridoxamine 5'-phosphate oxidase [Steroidobacteraceae bacterium]